MTLANPSSTALVVKLMSDVSPPYDEDLIAALEGSAIGSFSHDAGFQTERDARQQTREQREPLRRERESPREKLPRHSVHSAPKPEWWGMTRVIRGEFSGSPRLAGSIGFALLGFHLIPSTYYVVRGMDYRTSIRGSCHRRRSFRWLMDE